MMIPMLVPAALLAGPGASGLTMRLYNNSAWAGVPSQTSVVPTFDVTLPVGSGGAPFTVEITGSLTFPPGTKPCFENDQGCYTFNCSFGAATYGFLWFDDHLVCQNGAYIVKPDSFDGSAGNPLRVLSKKTITVRLQAYLDPANPHSLGTAQQPLSAQRLDIENNRVQLQPPFSSQLQGAAVSKNTSCNGSSWHEGDTLNGHDLPEKHTATMDECCAACMAEPSCAAVVWNAPGGKYGDSMCNMKWMAPPPPWKTTSKGEWGCRVRPGDGNGRPAGKKRSLN
jgi:hypothetical protein|eukprot:COSAG01_NODE_92_length_27199_cov_100.594649_21_plen_282_part_00